VVVPVDVDEPAVAADGVRPPPTSGVAVGAAEAPRRRVDACLVVVHTADPLLLGRRFGLGHGPTRIGSAIENDIVLAGAEVAPVHALLEPRGQSWVLRDAGSVAGTYTNDARVDAEAALRPGDRIAIGTTCFKLLAGVDIEQEYHEEIYRLTIIDGQTGAHNERYLLEALEREIIRARRHARPVAVLLFDVGDFERVEHAHGKALSGFVLKEIVALVRQHVGPDDVIARRSAHGFAIVLAQTLEGAERVGGLLQGAVRDHVFTPGAESVRVTITVRVAALEDANLSAKTLVARALASPARPG
jgi:diguanylate cyclase (GGDEF)-like protein